MVFFYLFIGVNREGNVLDFVLFLFIKGRCND